MSSGPVADLTGGCFCGAVAFHIQGTPFFNVYCHCTICQKTSGAPYLRISGFKPDDVKLTKGSETDLVPFNTTKNLIRYRCKHCQGPVFNQWIDTTSLFPFRGITHGTLTHQSAASPAIQPQQHIYYGTRMVDVKDGLPKFEGLMGVGPMAE
eukprot:TRINITY_DN3153_c0_g1_i2.p1 TRINITY_DN3153_c0_g1~~TRINITY_DN3153_c0_g1_i2.p1  ORF type:complete len:152 (-),score=42.89 TRINITY_DN3153_c0_g1_i2:167-622(-)